MNISRRRLRFTVLLLVVALGGLVAVQAVLLGQAWELKTQAFRRNVRSALGHTVQQIEAAEIAGGATALFLDGAVADSSATFFRALKPAQGHPAPGDSLCATTEFDTLVALVAFPDSVYDQEFLAHGISRTSEFGAMEHQMTVTIQGDRRQVIQRVVSGLIDSDRPPMAERLAAVPLDSILAAQLAAAGIDALPEVAVLGATDDTPVRVPAGRDPAAFAASAFRARLFGLDFAPPHHDLVLLFPGERAWLLRQTAPLFAASLLFLAVVVVGFFRTVRALMEQQRYAAQVVDFVNNMTHEFKTPLSTLTLAAEAIAHGADPADETLLRHTHMIREETARMGLQAERILQVARLERGELELAPTLVDGNRLAAGVAENFALRVEREGGRLAVDPAAPQATLRGDEMHLAGVLENLLDNALKYSPGEPDITLSTAVRAGHLVITVADRGRGVPKADRERVFEPYFRCPTGDRHDVKGHGLGLSYVRLVARAHGGDAILEENPGGGSCVIVKLPLVGEGGAP
ncbi:MAG: HAMP domain-containing histidine kinase [bacterium]|nr:HAMP domain-containing histidine kinase [bacterium]